MRTLLITGVSTGLGSAFARRALAAGHQVIGTVRREADRAAFEALTPGRSFGRILDVTDEAAAEPLVHEAESTIGLIDVLIANAGYGHEGTFKESRLASPYAGTFSTRAARRSAACGKGPSMPRS